jgi:pyrroline-5-carboxylate reductase
MTLETINARGMVLLGCGKMGSAMLAGWLARGVPAGSIWVQDPYPSEWLIGTGVHINEGFPEAPAVVLIAVKPQMMGEALPALAALPKEGVVFLSVAAGVPIAAYEAALGNNASIVRAMPNTPAAVAKGITAIIGNGNSSSAELDLAEALLSAVGQVVRLESESQMDAVTGVSGSGPAYVFYMIDSLAAAGVAQGLPADLSMQLAKATVAGAGVLAQAAEEAPEQLRINVTSPNGTTQAGLEVLMGSQALMPLMAATVKAATDRSKELGNG